MAETFDDKIFYQAGALIEPDTMSLASSFKCYKDGNDYKIIIELTIDGDLVDEETFRLKGDFKNGDGTSMTPDQIKKVPGYIFFPKSEKVEPPTSVTSPTATIAYSGGKSYVTVQLQVAGSGKTQSSQ